MGKPLMMMCVAALAAAAAADEWITGQTDPQTGSVDKTGALVYACCSSAGWVDGVMFQGFSEMEARGDVTLAPSSGWNHLTVATYVAAGNTDFSDEARRLLGGGVYHTTLGSQGLSSFSVTLGDLVPGRRYLAQFWVCDARDADRSGYSLTFDGQAVAGYNGNAEKSGQWAKCLFTAEAAAKTIAVTPNVVAAAQLNAFQLRDVSGGTVAWTTAATAGEDDVAVDGTLLYAYSRLEAVVNGVRFMPGAGKAAAWGGDVAFAPDVGAGYDLFFDTTGALGYSDAYRDLVRGGFWVDTTARYRMAVTLKGLTPGRNYLAQTWVMDNRAAAYRDRRVTVDGAAAMAHNQGTKGGAGSYAVGRFTAAAAEQAVYFFYDRSGSSTSIQPLFGPLQVRELDGTYPEHTMWTTGATDAVTGSVDTRGTLLYAYGGKAGSYCGLTMTAFTRNGTPRQGEDIDCACGNATIDGGYYTTQSAYLPDSVTTDENGNAIAGEVRSLIGGGIYNDKMAWGTGVDVALKNLKPGRRHLVQFWTCDARSTAGTGRRMRFDGWSASFGTTPPLGSWATRVFTATGTAAVVATLGGPWQINALQVRVLDDVDPAIAWAGGATADGTWDRSCFLKATDGRTTLSGAFPWLCRIVASLGTAAIDTTLEAAQRLEAYAPGVLEVCAGRTVVCASLGGSGTLRGPGRIDLKEGETVALPSALTLDGVVFGLGNAAVLAAGADGDLSAVTVRVDDPEARLAAGNDLLVAVSGVPAGAPALVLPPGNAEKYLCAWSAARGGFVLKRNKGTMLIFR